jgi:hypothetical protein
MTAAALRSVWKSYAQAGALLSSHSLRSSEIPIESYASLPMPSLRWKQPTWACFAAPSLMRPGQNRIGLPDRWWAIDAKSGRLAAYAREDIVSALHLDANAVDVVDGIVEIKPTGHTFEEVQDARGRVGTAIALVSEAFFEQRPAPGSNRAKVIAALDAALPREILALHRALAPDFFAWLES